MVRLRPAFGVFAVPLVVISDAPAQMRECFIGHSAAASVALIRVFLALAIGAGLQVDRIEPGGRDHEG